MQLREEFTYVIDVLLPRLVKYDYNVVAEKGELPFEAGHYHIHNTLERAGLIEESKGHTREALDTMMGFKCRLIFFCIINFDLLVSFISI